MRVELAEVKELDGGAEAVYRLTYEVADEAKPCCVADSSSATTPKTRAVTPSKLFLANEYSDMERNMTTTPRPEIGASAIANGIRTNYLEDGSGDQTSLLIHGSGPGVTSYANWRLVIPALAENFQVIAPDMVGFGYSDRPEGIEYSLDTWADQTVGLMDTLGIEKANLVGNSFGGGHRAADRDPASRPGRQAGADGQHGRALPDHRGPRTGVGLRAARSRTCARCWTIRLLPGTGQRRTGQGPLRGQHPARLPGVVLVDVPGAPAALGRGDEHARGGDPQAAAPHADRARPRGQGHPGCDLATS